MITINKEFINSYKEILEKKIDLFKEAFPQLEFDSNGRAFLCKSNISEDIYIHIYKKISNSSFNFAYFQDNLIKYMEKNKYEGIRNTYCNYIKPGDFTARDFFLTLDEGDFKNNYFHFKKESGDCIKVKMTRVLNKVYENIRVDFPDYDKLLKDLKEARNKSDLELVTKLKEEKESFEENHLIYIYDHILNNKALSSLDLYITVNPLDILTSSGTAYESEDRYKHTTFGSCYSVDFYKEKDNKNKDTIVAYRNGCYGEPEDLLLLGSIKNRAIIYTPNTNTINIPDTDFFFQGYKFRINSWLNFDDEDGYALFLEKAYPDANLYTNIVESILNNTEIEIESKPCEITAFHNKVQDYEMNQETLDNADCYLDYTAINDENELVMLDQCREHNDDGSNVGLDFLEVYSCCYECNSITHEDELCYSDYYEESYCEDCYNKLHVTCECCGNDFAKEELDYDFKTINGKYYCDECLENKPICSKCNAPFSGNVFMIEEDVLCNRCFNNTEVPKENNIEGDIIKGECI